MRTADELRAAALKLLSEAEKLSAVPKVIRNFHGADASREALGDL